MGTVEVIGPYVPALNTTVFPDPQEFRALWIVDWLAPDESVVQVAARAFPQASNAMMTTAS